MPRPVVWRPDVIIDYCGPERTTESKSGLFQLYVGAHLDHYPSETAAGWLPVK